MEQLKNVKKGERLKASTVNELINFRNASVRPQAGSKTNNFISTGTDDNLISVRNDTGNSLPSWSIVSITGATSDLLSTFIIDLPTKDYPVAITISPINQGQIGTAQIYGLTKVYINIVDETHTYAKIIEGDIEKLESSDAGPFRILAKSEVINSNGNRECTIYFPAGGSGESGPKAVKLAYASSAGTGGNITLQDVAIKPEASGTDTNWTVYGEVYTAKYLVGNIPG